MTTRAAKYRRISSDREGRELGVGRQDQDLDGFADQQGLMVVGDYCDNDKGASTRSKKPRPEYQRLIADAKAGKFDVVIAYTSGRLTRRPREFEDLIELAQEHGIAFRFIRSPDFDLNTASGRTIARVVASIDTGEAEQIAERVARDAQRRAEQGLYQGGRRPFGYTADGMALEPLEAAEVLRWHTALLGGVPLGQLAREAAAAGFLSTAGKPLRPSAVRAILLRARNAGLAVRKGRVIGKGQWAPIVDEQTHHAVAALLRDPRRRISTGNRAGYLLTGHGLCDACEGHLSSAWRVSANGGRRQVYRCRKGGNCATIRASWLDEYVTALVVGRLSRPDARDLLRDTDAPDLAALAEEETVLRGRLDDLATAFAGADINLSQLKAGSAKLNARLATIESALSRTDRAPVLGELVAADDVQAAWDAMPLDRQRAVVATLLSIRVRPGGAGIKKFNPDRVVVQWL